MSVIAVCCLRTLVVSSLLSTVWGLCDQKLIHRIVSHWDFNHPKNVLDQTVGVYTYVWLTPQFLAKDDPKVYCLATKVDADKKTATDIYVFKDLHNKYTVNYFKYENEGKITMKSEGLVDETQLAISLENHVLTFFQCVPQDKEDVYNWLVGIAVDVNYLEDIQTLEAVDAGKKKLTTLGINKGGELFPCTPQLVEEYNTPP